MNIHLTEVICLRSPQDNNQKMAGWGGKCEELPTFDRATKFDWDSLGAQTEYRLTIDRYRCSKFGQIESVIEKNLQDIITIQPALPASKTDRFYLMRLTAFHNDRKTGILIIHGNSGMGLDYRFRMK